MDIFHSFILWGVQELASVFKSFWVQFVDEVPFHGDTVTIALCKLNVKVLIPNAIV